MFYTIVFAIAVGGYVQIGIEAQLVPNKNVILQIHDQFQKDKIGLRLKRENEFTGGQEFEDGEVSEAAVERKRRSVFENNFFNLVEKLNRRYKRSDTSEEEEQSYEDYEEIDENGKKKERRRRSLDEDTITEQPTRRKRSLGLQLADIRGDHSRDSNSDSVEEKDALRFKREDDESYSEENEENTEQPNRGKRSLVLLLTNIRDHSRDSYSDSVEEKGELRFKRENSESYSDENEENTEQSSRKKRSLDFLLSDIRGDQSRDSYSNSVEEKGGLRIKREEGESYSEENEENTEQPSRRKRSLILLLTDSRRDHSRDSYSNSVEENGGLRYKREDSDSYSDENEENTEQSSKRKRSLNFQLADIRRDRSRDSYSNSIEERLVPRSKREDKHDSSNSDDEENIEQLAKRKRSIDYALLSEDIKAAISRDSDSYSVEDKNELRFKRDTDVQDDYYSGSEEDGYAERKKRSAIEPNLRLKRQENSLSKSKEPIVINPEIKDNIETIKSTLEKRSISEKKSSHRFGFPSTGGRYGGYGYGGSYGYGTPYGGYGVGYGGYGTYPRYTVYSPYQTFGYAPTGYPVGTVFGSVLGNVLRNAIAGAAATSSPITSAPVLTTTRATTAAPITTTTPSSYYYY